MTERDPQTASRIETIPPWPDAAFSIDALNEGEHKAQHDPASLTDRELRHIACYDQRRAQRFAVKRAEALAQRHAATPLTVQAAKPPEKLSSREKLLAQRFGPHGETYQQWLVGPAPDLHSKTTKFFDEKFDGLVATPLFMTAFLWFYADAINEKNKERNARLDALEARVAELEAQPQLKHCGTWHEDSGYLAGSLVTKNGGLWLAERDTSALPGTHASGWRLIVKSGHAQ